MTIQRDEAEPGSDETTPVHVFVNNTKVFSTSLGPAGKATVPSDMIEAALKQTDATRAAAASENS